MRRLARGRLWYDLHIGEDIWNTIGNSRFTATYCWVSPVNLRPSATMRGATDFRTGTSANFRWTRGLVTLRQSSMLQDSQGSPFLRCRKGARLPLRLRSGIRSASRILSFLEDVQLVDSIVRITRMPTENDLRRWLH